MYAHYYIGEYDKENLRFENNIWYTMPDDKELFYSDNHSYDLSMYMEKRFGKSIILSYCQCGYTWFLQKDLLLSVINDNPDFFLGFDTDSLKEDKFYYLAWDDES